jgi:hypothetical protein
MKLSHAMHNALQAVIAGTTPADAALAYGVTRQALYVAMRRHGVGDRCPTCHQLLRRPKPEDIEPDMPAFLRRQAE